MFPLRKFALRKFHKKCIKNDRHYQKFIATESRLPTASANKFAEAPKLEMESILGVLSFSLWTYSVLAVGREAWVDISKIEVSASAEPHLVTSFLVGFQSHESLLRVITVSCRQFSYNSIRHCLEQQCVFWNPTHNRSPSTNKDETL
ncbi:unnamed protein product [Ceratitis capitata]|uniref:(Mediterranean fruit fly) hypothetical protein n=1 Tax=Ceratitis capitata TaxID=7213 RepID=A0A811V5C3_CERCA|nr:unnamed protein product [Ceratitis capitata]